MTPVQEAVTSVLRNSRIFSGRAGRPEFWWFALAAYVVYVIAGLIPGISWIVYPVLALLSLAVTVRRLHDTDRSGWWVILPYAVPYAVFAVDLLLPAFPTDRLVVNWLSAGPILIAIAVEIALLIMLVQPGTRGPNKYGPDPLQRGGSGVYARTLDERGTGNRWVGNTFIYLLIAVAVIAVFFMLFSPRDDGDHVDLATILAMAENGQVTSITVEGDRLIARQNGQQFIASKDPGTSIFEVFQSAGINPGERGIRVEVQRSGGLENLFGILIQWTPLMFLGIVLLVAAIVACILIRRN